MLMKRFQFFLFVAVVAAGGLGVSQAYDYATMTPKDQLLLENVEALAGSEGGGEDGSSWWDSKIYDCTQVEVWEFDYYFFKDLPIGAGEVYVGPPHDPYDICYGYFKKNKTDCIAGSSVAHCWDC